MGKMKSELVSSFWQEEKKLLKEIKQFSEQFGIFFLVRKNMA